MTLNRKTLDELIEEAKDYKMTPKEKLEQKISWARGELMMICPSLSRDEADKRVRKALDNMSDL